MKQRINLYQASLQPVKKLISANRVGITALSSILVLILLVVFISVSANSVQRKLAREQVQLEQLQANINELSERANQQRVSRELSRRVNNLESEIAAKRQLLRDFNSQRQVQDINFSHVLGDLSEIHMEGVWLTRIRANQQGVEIYGRTLQPAVIPIWMGKFSEVGTLNPFQFSVVELQREQNEERSGASRPLNFGIVSSPSHPQASAQRGGR